MKIIDTIKQEWGNLQQNSNKNMIFSLFFAIFILFLYCYFGTYSFFENTFDVADKDFWKIIYHNCMSFVLFFGLGTLFIKFFMKKKLSDFGFQRSKNKKFTQIILLLGLIILPLLGLSCVLDKGMSSTYPLVDFNTYGQWWQIGLYFLSYLLYYIGWETLFRGILYFGCEEKCGVLGAILITTLISALIHTSIAGFGKPMIETLSAIPAGLIFGYFAYKTRSIYTSLYCHILIGFFTDIFIFLIV